MRHSQADSSLQSRSETRDSLELVPRVSFVGHLSSFVQSIWSRIYNVQSLVALAILMTVATRQSLLGNAAYPWYELVGLALLLGASLVLKYALPLQNNAVVFLRQGLVASFVLLPIAVQGYLRFGGGRESSEAFLLVAVASVMLAVSACSPDRHRSLLPLISGFIVLFSLNLSPTWLGWVIAGVYFLLLVSLFMRDNWQLAADHLERTSTGKKRSVERSVEHRRVIGIVLLMVAFPTFFSVAFLRYQGKIEPLFDGWLPTSGGMHQADSNALSGIGNGDAVVSAQNKADSFGPVESEIFLDSDKPSLYDMLNDLYGEPPKPMKQRNRAIAMAGPDDLETKRQKSESSKVSREFDTRRTPKRNQKSAKKDALAKAMFFVEGRVTQHFALQRYDSFDGSLWSGEFTHDYQPRLRLEFQSGEPWIEVKRDEPKPYFRGEQFQKLKFVNLDSARIPSPFTIESVHIDKVDQPHFFGWTTDGSLEMRERDRIPPLTVLHIQSQKINLNSLRKTDFSEEFRKLDLNSKEPSANTVLAEVIAKHLELPASMPKTRQLAEEWTSGVPRGWRQVDAIQAKLREYCERDDEVSFDGDINTVEQFLDSRSGPAYLFPSAAICMLRSQGYPARLVTGFYAHRSNYDKRNGHTEVLGGHAHVWLEVCVDGRNWIAVDPTPGFAPPQEQRNLVELATWTFERALLWSLDNPFVSITIIALLGLTFWKRHQIVEFRAWLFFRTRVLFGANLAVQTLHYLDRKAKRSGQSRPAHCTLRRFYSQRLRLDESHPGIKWNRLIEQLEEAHYCPNHKPGSAAGEQRLCLRTAAALKWKPLIVGEPKPGFRRAFYRTPKSINAFAKN